MEDEKGAAVEKKTIGATSSTTSTVARGQPEAHRRAVGISSPLAWPRRRCMSLATALSPV